jgi:hypothetical protein
MNKLLLLVVILSFGMISYSQIQLQNAGFEQWEDVGLGTDNMEPVHWSSIKTSDNTNLNPLAPVVWFKSTDAHSGNYSVELQNVETILVATGTLTNGRVHSDLDPANQYIFTNPNDSKYNCPIIFRPDSVVGWYKFYPVNNDTIQVRVVLHKGYAKIPDDNMTNWVGQAFFKSGSDTVDQWTRFSVPFEYYSQDNPEYALVILNSGNGFDAQPNSIAYFDDIELIYNTPPNAIRANRQQNISLYLDDSRQLSLKGIPLTTYKSLRIIDITGRQIWTCPITSDQVDLSGLNLIRGIYLVTLKNDQNIFVQKLIIN